MTGLLSSQFDALHRALSVEVTGRVTSFTGLTIRAEGLRVPVGSTCEIEIGRGDAVRAEVIGFNGDATLLMPVTSVFGMARGQRVRCITASQRIQVGQGLLGRVVDGLGRALDDGPPPEADEAYPLHRAAPHVLRRPRIGRPLSVGVRSINAMLTAGLGQRLGIFAGTGVGKSVLLGMMARYTSADVVVIALVGERGREVGEFLDRDLQADGRRRSVVVVSTSDQSAVLRVRAAFAATAIAEYFRDQGADVLFLMDSVTRVAMAQREIGLAAGEPPTTKGYPPSVYALLPRLLERAGRTPEGSITGLYSVLVEGDDITEPVSDAVRGILDGHVWLSRRLAMRSHYPAVGVLESISRVMPDVVDDEHLAAARRVQRLRAVWEDIADLVNIGAYAAGTNPEYDLAIRARPWIETFLQQDRDEASEFDASRAGLMELVQRIDAAENEPGRPSEPGRSARSAAPPQLANAASQPSG
ncbi:MAG: FliI/YscN family ATPase [Phycisphaerae bacterium]